MTYWPSSGDFVFRSVSCPQKISPITATLKQNAVSEIMGVVSVSLGGKIEIQGGKSCKVKTWKNVVLFIYSFFLQQWIIWWSTFNLMEKCFQFELMTTFFTKTIYFITIIKKNKIIQSYNSDLAFLLPSRSIFWSCSRTMLVTHYCQWAVQLHCLSYFRLSHLLATPLECYIEAPQCEKWNNANSSKWFIFSACSEWKSARVVSWGSILLSRALPPAERIQQRLSCWTLELLFCTAPFVASTVWRHSLLVSPG